MLIQVSEERAKALKKLKIVDNETYDSILKRLIKTYKMAIKEKWI